MKAILISATLAFSSIALATKTSPDLKPMTGRQLLGVFTHSCSSENFRALHSGFEHSHLLEATVPVARLKSNQGQVLTADGKFAASDSDKSYHLSVGGQDFSDTDPCSVIVSAVQSLRGQHALYSFLVPSAEAQTALVKDRDMTPNYIAAAGAVVAAIALAPAVAAVATIGLAEVGVAALVAGGGFGAVTVGSAVRDSQSWTQATGIINSNFKLSCGPTSIQITGAGGKLSCAPSLDFKLPEGFVLVHDGKMKRLNFYEVPSVQMLFQSLATSCKNDEDAKRIEKELQSGSFRKNVALLISDDSTTSIQGAESKSVR